MQFLEKIKSLAERAPALVQHLETEEATKNALVMPFIAALGYDVFNPQEVIPEFTADVGIKKGEKVDYAIKNGGNIAIIVEAKKAGVDLTKENHGQLLRYFAVTHARIAVLTNGTMFQFFSDLDEPNKMDKSPFLTLNLLSLRDDLLPELSKLTKDNYDLDEMLSRANEVKYREAIRAIVAAQFDAPDEEFVKFFFRAVKPKGSNYSPSAKELFTRLVEEACKQYIADRVQIRLRSALAQEEGSEPPQMQPAQDASAPAESAPDAAPDESVGGDEDNGVVTTDEELQGSRVVRAIICDSIPLERVADRDTKSYFGILADDNNRKPICRLHFNRKKKYIGIFDTAKNETRHEIDDVVGIYKFANELRAIAEHYTSDASDGGSPQSQQASEPTTQANEV